MMRVLVTGGTGAVGLAAVRHLARAGHEVICLALRADRHDPMLERFLSEIRHRVTVLGGDVGDRKALAAVWAEYCPTHVVHAAAITPTQSMEMTMGPMIVDANLVGTVNVLDAAIKGDTKRVIYISSAGVYGETDEDSTVTETDSVHPVNFYSITKLTSEQLCAYYTKLHGLETVVVRVGWVYGPVERPMAGSREVMSLAYEWVRQALDGQEIRMAHLEHKRDWIHSDDVGRALLVLLEQDRVSSLLYNLAGQQGYSHAQVLTALNTVIPVGFRQVLDPAEATIPPALSRKRRGPLDMGKLTAETSYRPYYSLEDGLRNYVDWVRSERKAGS